MHLKLGKSFPLLKFKPKIFEPLRLHQSLSTKKQFKLGDPLLTFNDLISIDCLLARTIEQTKNSVQKYIKSVVEGNVQAFQQNAKQLNQSLEIIYQIIQRLDFENIQRDISQLFKGEFGLYSLFRYAWNADLLHSLQNIRLSFELKQSNSNDPQILTYFKKNEKYIQALKQLYHKQSKTLLKQFIRQMYIVPPQWGYKLVKHSPIQERVKKIFMKEHLQKQNHFSQLLVLYGNQNTDQISQFKILVKGLFYHNIQTQFYAYLTLLKTMLLNKVSGIFNGDYEIWEQIYDICLKIYSRKENARGKHGVQVDQIIQHQIEDAEFTNFITKSQNVQISLSTINFYFKNCPKSVQGLLRPVIMIKIKKVLARLQFKQYEDVIEYLQTEATNQQKEEILVQLKNSLFRIFESQISQNSFFEIQKAVSDLMEYLLKNEEKYFEVISVQLLKKMNDSIKAAHRQNSLAVFAYLFTNTMLIQAYEQQFDFNSHICEHGKEFLRLLQQIVINLKRVHGLQIHEDAISIINQLRRVRISNDSDSENEGCKQEEVDKQNLEEISEQVASLMIMSGKDCEFKLQHSLNDQQSKQFIANEITRLFKKLSDSLFEERKQIQRFMTQKRKNDYSIQDKSKVYSFLAIKGFKDRLLHENIMNLSIRMHPVISFSQIAQFAIQFLTFMTPYMIDQPLPVGAQIQYGTIQPFDVCDVISGQQPIQCMKLIYKQIPEFEESLFDFQAFDKLPTCLFKQLWSCSNNRSGLAKQIVELDQQISIIVMDRVEDFKKFLFYAELMNKVFSKLNQKSQKGIKQIKVIYSAMEKICFKIWQHASHRIISSQIYALCQQNQKFKQKVHRMNKSQANNLKMLLTKQSIDFSQMTFNKLIKSIKLPYADSILSQQNYITKVCQQFLCFSISKVINPSGFFKQYEKIFNPLLPFQIQKLDKTMQASLSVQFRQNYQTISQIVEALAMIQFTCSNQQGQQNMEKEQQKLWSTKWRQNCIKLTENLLKTIARLDTQANQGQKAEAKSKSLWVSVFLVHLKAEIIKILIPYLIKDPLKHPLENPKMYNSQLGQTFTIFSSLCEIVQKISPGEQDHLMTFLEIFEGYQNSAGQSKNNQTNSKISQFLYKAIETLLALVFKGIRVRSYHFYKFIKSYLKLTKQKQNYLFFNSVISYYIENLMKSVIPHFALPGTILQFCDENMNSLNNKNRQLKQNVNKQALINENSLKKSVSKIRFSKFIRFQSKFQSSAEKICVISMFINLFCRLNFKSLTDGIQKIWETQQMHLVYLEYLQRIVNLLSNQVKRTDQKLLDIINVDCFGNLSIIFRGPLSQKNKKVKGSANEDYTHKMIYQFLKLIKQVLKSSIGSSIKNSLAIPVKKISNEIKSSLTTNETLDYISKTIGELNLSAVNAFDTQEGKKENNQEKASQNVDCSQILDMILTCYNTKLSRQISSNVHINNIVFVCQDSQLKLRVLENNMSSLERRMSRKQIRAALQKYSKKQEPIIKLKARRCSINKKQGKSEQKQEKKLSQVADIETSVKITAQSEQLIYKVIKNFIISYREIFKHGPNASNKDSTNQVSTLFNNLKILALVTLNNHEVVKYLQQYRVDGFTVYDIMIDSVKNCIPVFAQLYVTFLKTNLGFTKKTNQQSKQEQIVPNSMLIQFQVKQNLLNSLIQCIEDEHSGKKQANQIQLQNLLKVLLLVTKISTSQSRPNFRCYKFGNISNRNYTEFHAQMQNKYFKALAHTLKHGITRMENTNFKNQNCLHVLALYQEVMSKILKQSDLAWMKLNLDIELKKIDYEHFQQPQLGVLAKNKQIWSINLQQTQTNLNKVSQPECNSRGQLHSHRYSFSYQLIPEQLYSILHKLSNNKAACTRTLLILQKLVDYSAKLAIWDIGDEETLLYGGSLSGSFGIDCLQDTNQGNNHENIEDNCCGIIQNDSQVEQQYKSIIDQHQQVNTPTNRNRSSGSHASYSQEQVKQKQECDGIIEQDDYDCIVEDQTDMYVGVDQLNQCMSQTSLKFLSQHSVSLFPQPQQTQMKQGINSKEQEELDLAPATKQVLQTLYQQSSINPECRKQLLQAITTANSMQLQRFISKEGVDQQIQMIVVRELWGRGIMPSATSICRSNKYYANIGTSTINNVSIFNNMPNNISTTAGGLSMYINEAIGYKRMYESYSKVIKISPTQEYVPVIPKSQLQRVLLYSINKCCSQIEVSLPNKSVRGQVSPWGILSKISLHPTNMFNIFSFCLSYLGKNDSLIQEKLQQIHPNFSSKTSGNKIKLVIIDMILAGCIEQRIGLSLLFNAYWNCQSQQIAFSTHNENTMQCNQQKQICIIIPVLEFILKQSCLIQEIVSLSSGCKEGNGSNFVRTLWKYFSSCDQFNAHSKLQNNMDPQHQQRCMYPYYQMQESLRISDNIVRKFVDRLFASRAVISNPNADRSPSCSNNQNKPTIRSSVQQLFMILVYLDPLSFQAYFRTVIDKISCKLTEIIKKQQKILANFQSQWSSCNQNDSQQIIQMLKEQKYWNLHQSKKSISSFEQQLQYFRNVLVNISVHILPKFKKIRFNYHCGKQYRDWKLQIQILKQKMLTSGSLDGLTQLQEKERQLQDWRRDQSNRIINEEILPIVENGSQQFMKVLIQAQGFIAQFLQVFKIKEHTEKIVIYNICAKLYEILLASQILTHEQKPTYHSMSKLKTSQSIDSLKNMNPQNMVKNRRKSSMQTTRKSARTSISPCLPKVQSLLKKIGPSCTFLHNYIGNQQSMRQLHAKYSDASQRLKVLWAHRVNHNLNPDSKSEKQKIIECRRTHILADTFAEIDQDFIKLPVKIKFESEIGIDYGGVTRQWITLFMKEVINPNLGLFSLSANKQTFQPNPNSYLVPNHLRYFKKIGILVGKAMKQNWLLQVNLTKSFLKHLLGSTLYIQDLEDIDPETAKSLKWILQNDIGYDDMLGINFTYQKQRFGKKETVELVPGGSEIPVTQQNKKNYVKMLAKIKMTQEIRQQSMAFMSGVQSVIPYSTLKLFSYKQISLYLSGMPTIDLTQMKLYARYENWTPQSQQIVWFWQILAEWTQAQLANFLFFLTGSYKVPYGGFKEQPIGFNKIASGTDYLPVAHTCFSVVDFSHYSSKERMAKVLKKSIQEGKGFSVS